MHESSLIVIFIFYLFSLKSFPFVKVQTLLTTASEYLLYQTLVSYRDKPHPHTVKPHPHTVKPYIRNSIKVKPKHCMTSVVIVILSNYHNHANCLANEYSVQNNF